MTFSIADRTVLITGGNTGIGKATALALAARGARVTIACRDAERAAAASDEIEDATGNPIDVLPLDLASLASVRDAAAQFAAEHHTLDVLINNAGVAVFGRRRDTTDGFERQFGVNHLGHFVLTMSLLDRITARIVNVSSAGYALARDGLRWDDLQWEQDYDGWQAYGASKLCNLYFTWELADRLRDRGVTANALHPGFVDTDLGYRRPEEGGKPRPALDASTAGAAVVGVVGVVEGGGGGGGGGPDLSALGTPLTATEGARTSVMLATDPALAAVTGAYFDDRQRRVDLDGVAVDREASARLWDLSLRLTT